jgi:hypothetical protein
MTLFPARSSCAVCLSPTAPPHYGLAVLDRLLSTPPRGDAVTDPSLPHTANSADGTFTRLSTAFAGARLSPVPNFYSFGVHLTYRGAYQKGISSIITLFQ